MLLGHVAATVVTTLVLAYGESLLWRWGGRLVRRPLAGSHARPGRVVGSPWLGRGRPLAPASSPGRLCAAVHPGLAPVVG